MDGAGPAVRRVAADDGPGLPENLPQVLDEQHPGLDVVAVRDAVDLDLDSGHRASSLRLAGGESHSVILDHILTRRRRPRRSPYRQVIRTLPCAVNAVFAARRRGGGAGQSEASWWMRPSSSDSRRPAPPQRSAMISA